ncbi:MAG: hypothetical protein V7736_09085 [Colwellia polaris]|jgi:hypothetical protein
MIFNDKYSCDENELLKSDKYKEFSLIQSDVDYTTRSLGLIYDMYCRWLNTNHGIYLVKAKLSIPDGSDKCSESVIDYLFHMVQGNIKHRNVRSDNSIGLIWKTYRKDSSTIHEGYFLISMTEAEYDKPRDKKMSSFSMDVFKSVGDSLSQLKAKFYNESDMEFDKEIGLHFEFLFNIDGKGGLFHDSSFEVHEQGFTTLCKIAQLSIDKPDTESPLFRTRYGYSPVHWYFGNDSLEPFVAQTQQNKPFLDNDWGEYKLNSQQP